jgi:hypothetical protein
MMKIPAISKYQNRGGMNNRGPRAGIHNIHNQSRHKKLILGQRKALSLHR